MAVANCPACGGPIEFAVGSSIVVVCDYCHSAVARTDRALEDLGKVAALVDTGSPLKRNLPGKYHGSGFRITGRTQMRHAAGGVWDEWYAAFDDGRWGWIAEAQGRFYVTFRVEAHDLPPRAVIEPGGRYRGELVVDEVGTATVISGEGEIPWRVEPGSTYDYADLSGKGSRFATIDYSEEQPLLFLGEQTSLEGLGIATDERPARGQKVAVGKISCSNCGGPLPLVAPEQAERVICPNCGGVHDLEEGNLRFLEVLKSRGPRPLVPLGTKGKLNGEEYIVAGYMQRSVTFDRKYFWSEYLLFHPVSRSFRWLIESDQHWSFAQPVPGAEVDDSSPSSAATTVRYGGQTFRIFQDALAHVEHVLGEFYWRVEVGEQVRAIDYIAPPRGLSKELSGQRGAQELNYTLSEYVPVDAIEQGFGVKGLPRPRGVGMLQPYAGIALGRTWALLMLALLLVAIVLGVTRAHTTVFQQQIDFEESASASWSDSSTPSTVQRSGNEASRVLFTKPFTVKGGQNLMVEASAPVNNSWIYIGGDIANEGTGMLDSFDLPLEYYEGVEDGEHWSEGSKSKTVYLAAVPAGTYSMRLEGQWAADKSPPPVTIEVREGVFRWSHFFIAFLLITVPAILLKGRRAAFEAQRWNEASFTPLGTRKDGGGGGGDDDE